jgi:multimeric flavodoxin WrbA
MATDLTRRSFLGAAGTAVAAGTVTTAAFAADGDKEGRVKIVGICCSPRPGMTTFQALQVCLNAAQKASERIDIELIELAGKRIEGSVAAGVPLPEGERDDFPPLVPKLSAPNVGGIVVATPVYFANMSSLCKAFLERCMAFRKRDFALGGKVAGVLAVGGSRNGGQELTIRSVQTALMCQEMIIVGEARPSAHMGGTVWSGTPGGVTEDEFGMNSAKALGRHVAQVALRLA